jgi:prefoldin subunit 5
LALGALQEKQPLALNVLPQKMRKRHHQLPVVVALLLALLWGGWFALGQFGAYRELRRELASYRDRNQVLQEQLIELTAAKREYESAKELVGHLEPYLYSEGLVIKCLKILTDLLPEDTHMTSFRINDYNKVTIQIETAQFYAVRKALEAQPYFKNVDTANAISKTRKGDLEKTTVKMELNLEAFHGQEIQ